jgi:tetratricopeptide (TPR) repeat protein
MSPDRYDLRSKGYEHLSDGNYQAAILAFKKAIEISPDFTSAYYYMGLAYADAGDNKNAIKMFRKCTKLGLEGLFWTSDDDDKFTDQDPYYHMGWCYEDIGQIQAAKKALRQSIKHNPNWLESYYRLGRIYHKEGNYSEAAKIYKSALENSLRRKNLSGFIVLKEIKFAYERAISRKRFEEYELSNDDMKQALGSEKKQLQQLLRELKGQP